jgi:hypothetical protein
MAAAFISRSVAAARRPGSSGMSGGKRHDVELGPCHTFSLEEAREKARLARQLLYKGGGPLIEKKRAKRPTAVAKPAG